MTEQYCHREATTVTKFPKSKNKTKKTEEVQVSTDRKEAFPTEATYDGGTFTINGLSQREYYAVRLAAALVVNGNYRLETIPVTAFEMADLMIEQGEKH